MPQLKEDEWPEDQEPTTTEEEAQDTRPDTSGTSDDYPPPLPPEATPTKDAG